MVAVTEVPPMWRPVGTLLIIGVAIGTVLGHQRRSFGSVATILGAFVLVPVALTMGDPFRATELVYVVLFHQALFRSFRSLAIAAVAWVGALAVSVALGTWLLPNFVWDIYEVVLQIPAILLVGVIYVLGVSVGRHERAALREQVLAAAGSDLVAAETRADVYAVALSAARALTEPHADVDVTLSVGTHDRMRIVANHTRSGVDLSGLNFEIGKSETLLALFAEGRMFELGPERALEALQALGFVPQNRFRWAGSLLIVPLMVQREPRGSLTVIASTALPDECKGGLATLATEIALALETIDLNERLAHQAFHDPLTGLANRRLLAQRAGEPMVGRSDGRALLVLDLDSFKVVNDSLGHAAGDRMLVEIAERVTACLPDAHCAARLGGDEFAILIQGLRHPEAEARALAERLLDALRQPLTLDGNAIVPEASIGIVAGDASTSFEALLADADLAMYAAKRSGKGRYVMFEHALRDAAVRQLELEVELRRGLEQQEFELHYQPVVEFGSGRLVVLEGLVRWRHPRRGLLVPDEFIPHAEATGFIVPLGRWILGEACRQARAFAESGLTVRVGVNLSPRQLEQENLEEMVRSALTEAGASPHTLTLELTETSLIQRTDSILAQLRALQEMGVHLALDDFGTGYSSLAYLRDFPFDAVKIDRSFIQGIETDPEQAAFVRAIVTMTHTLHMRVIGEGVETPAQFARLRALGCDAGQGYHIGPPMPASAVEAWLETASRQAAA
jgi:diguanylate cyclase (GGDEF)-like protein